MTKFNIGDKVIGNAKASEEYNITKEGTVAKVLELYDEQIEVEIIEVTDDISDDEIGKRYVVYCDCFDLFEEEYIEEDFVEVEQNGTIIRGTPTTVAELMKLLKEE